MGKKLSVVCWLLSGVVTGAYAGDAGFAFLKIIPGAKLSGLSTVYTAVEGGNQSLALNPAGVVVKKKYEISATHLELFEDMRLENVSFAHKYGETGNLAYWLTWINEGDQEGRDINRAPTGSFSNNEYAGGINYSFQHGTARFGVGVKTLHSRIGQESGTGFAADGGVIVPFKGVNLGLSVTNLGKAPKLGGDGSDLPLTVNSGIAFNIVKNVMMTADLRRNLPEKRTSYGGGLEATLYELIALRGGYLYSKDNGEKGDKGLAKGLSAGFGIDLPVLTLDYAITSMGELGYTHRATLGLTF